MGWRGWRETQPQMKRNEHVSHAHRSQSTVASRASLRCKHNPCSGAFSIATLTRVFEHSIMRPGTLRRPRLESAISGLHRGHWSGLGSKIQSGRSRSRLPKHMYSHIYLIPLWKPFCLSCRSNFGTDHEVFKTLVDFEASWSL